ncbi:MAG: leucine-rich repeat protein [Clostridia bacterium]|nr:leucine-rich repeat protein [Clostridia bacterium]
MKNFMRGLVSFVGCLMLLFGFVACEDNENQAIQGEKGERGEQGIQGEKGEKGDKGDDGKDGVSPTISIGENGNWHIDGVDTGVKAQGETGQAGKDGVNGRDGVDGTDGVDGKDGIDGTNGVDGKDGANGRDGVDGVDGKDGVDGTNGVDGKDGVGIEKVEYDENGDLKITFTDKTTQTIIMPDKHVHTFGEWTNFSADEVPCERRLFYRVCLSCPSVEWKQGTNNDHTWHTVTTAPTCQAQGYDTKTCSICGKVEIENYTQTNEHQWKDNYAFDNSFHWLDCENCDSNLEYAEHDIDNSGYCIVCEQPLLPTEGLVYDVSACGTYAEVIAYTGTATKIKIADTYKSLPVESIYDSVFDGREDIIAVSFPETLKSIGDNAFRQTGLTEITLPESLTKIGRNTFSYCSSLTTIYFNATECRYMPTTISGFDEWIVSAPFSDTIGRSYENEIDIFIAKNVTYIPSCMFSGGKNSWYYKPLPINVYFEEESVCEWIGSYAFHNSQLKSINLPSTIKSIGDGAFANCSLMEIELPSGLTEIGEDTFCYSGLQKIVIPEGVTIIRRGALLGIPSVELPNSIETIEQSVFDSDLQCTEYENCLYIGNKTNPYLLLVKVKNTIYSTYKIHSDTKLIYYDAFGDCTRMSTCVIGKNLKKIDASDWWGSFPVLSKIYYEGTVQDWANSGLADKSSLKDAEMYYYSGEEPALNSSKTDYNGKYWKYGENGEIVVWIFNKE